VPDIGGIPVAACNEMTAAEYPGTQPGANADINKISAALAGPKIILTQGIQIGILLDPDWKVPTHAAGDLLDKVHFRPAEIDRILDDAAA